MSGTHGSVRFNFLSAWTRSPLGSYSPSPTGPSLEIVDTKIATAVKVDAEKVYRCVTGILAVTASLHSADFAALCSRWTKCSERQSERRPITDPERRRSTFRSSTTIPHEKRERGRRRLSRS